MQTSINEGNGSNSRGEPNVRSIDVGYGNTKFVVSTRGSSDFSCDIIPSITATASAVDGSLSAGIASKRNTVQVEVNGLKYEVGREANLCVDSTYNRNITEGFAMTDSYLALLRGALSYMNVSVIDLLVVGLPILTYPKYKNELAAKIKGIHRVSVIQHPNNPGPAERDVEIKRVVAFPQPLGGLLDYANQKNRMQEIQRERTLVVDPGYYTLDWLVCNGIQPNEARSGAQAGGISSVLQAIAGAITRSNPDRPVKDLMAIDTAIRDNINPRFYGAEVSMEDYLPAGIDKARQHVAVLANKVGNGEDIDNIVLVGGGTKFFYEVLKEKYPHHMIDVLRRPIYSNVRGFQIGGMQLARKMATQDH